MSVRPLSVEADGVRVLHDDPGYGHESVVPFSSLVAPTGRDGQADDRFLTVPCAFPGCASVSLHPIGGGSAPRAVQRLFVHMVKRARAGRTWNQAKALVRARIAMAEGAERWLLEDEGESGEVGA